MGKSSPRNPLWPDWFDGEKIDEVTFCHELIRNHPMKCIENRFFTPDGPVEDEAELKQLILKEIQAFIIHGLSKRVANLLESLRIIAYSAPLDIEVANVVASVMKRWAMELGATHYTHRKAACSAETACLWPITRKLPSQNAGWPF